MAKIADNESGKTAESAGAVVIPLRPQTRDPVVVDAKLARSLAAMPRDEAIAWIVRHLLYPDVPMRQKYAIAHLLADVDGATPEQIARARRELRAPALPRPAVPSRDRILALLVTAAATQTTPEFRASLRRKDLAPVAKKITDAQLAALHAAKKWNVAKDRRSRSVSWRWRLVKPVLEALGFKEEIATVRVRWDEYKRALPREK